ncbi:hypothetical protein BCR36DRAFT_326775 [Piromyces finnis]|uniref:Coth-domain-containing protein n=1 Tax=Piromyces finnis TaxID=1754191 RepID=A0A1Y1V9R4_9FUNG|nr:hypothetical protein BCR36DRAFT_326775 [Piromyces finnis]|eukprot:ORX50253.1 hypothetical protein BCR36DRAFT_326775 [Piromyces finnis]
MSYLTLICIFYCLLSWVKANCDFLNAKDYVKNSNRTFNPLEGKVITIKIDMTEKNYKKLIEIAQVSSYDLYYKYNMDYDKLENFEEKVNMTTIIDGSEEKYEKINFKTGGRYGRVQDRIGFNLKLKKDKLFYNRKDLRLRPDASDYTHIRSKISADLMNRWNIHSVQETYTELYINNNYYGLYFLMDSIKPSWIKQNFDNQNQNGNDDDDVRTLYHCQSFNSNLDPINIKKCFNEKDEYLNYTEPLYNMANDLQNVTTIEELSDIFNIENFTRTIIAEYLFSSFDNYLIIGHNYHLYQSPNGIWEIIDHDYDSNFGVNLKTVLGGYISLNYTAVVEFDKYVKLDFDHWYTDERKIPIIDILYHKNKKRFISILEKMLITGFNPDELFKRIDYLSNLIEPYVRNETEINKDGIYPGRINLVGNPSNHTMEIFHSNTNYDMVDNIPGLKDFIQKKFNAVCNIYKLNKSKILLEARLYQAQMAIENKLKEIKEILVETNSKFYSSFNETLNNFIDVFETYN